MDEGDDEDVILVDSPLYLHMKEMGFEEFETAERCDNISIEESVMKASTEEKSAEESIKVKGYPLKVIVFKLWKHILQGIFSLNPKTSKEIRKIIIESCVLQESDQALLEDLLDEFVCKEKQNGDKALFSISKLLLSNFCVMAITGLLLSYSIAFLVFLEYTVWNCIMFIMAFLYLVTVLCLWTFWTTWKSKSLQLTKATSEVLECASNLHDSFKKGIRMVQEAELIARGFTLISVQATAQRLESSLTLPVRSPEKQCPELREATFHFARKCFFTYRNATYQLLKMFPLHKEIDMSSHYLACIKLEDLGPLFISQETTQNISERFSEFFSVSSLKSVVQLMELQQSEFFRRFGLSFLHVLSVDTNFDKVFKVSQMYSTMENILKQVLEIASNAVSSLHRIQLYYKHLGISKCDHLAPKEFKTQSHISAFQTAVHSLLLHLQASIIRVQDLENEVLANGF